MVNKIDNSLDNLKKEGFNEHQINAIKSKNPTRLAFEIFASSGCVDDYMQYSGVKSLEDNIKNVEKIFYDIPKEDNDIRTL